MTIKAEYMNAAVAAADPVLGRRRAYVAGLAADDPAHRSKAFSEETDYLERAARVRVRRVVAALNGLDIETTNAPDMDETGVVLLSREMVDRLKTALLNGTVASALDSVMGQEAASVLMGEIAVL